MNITGYKNKYKLIIDTIINTEKKLYKEKKNLNRKEMMNGYKE